MDAGTTMLPRITETDSPSAIAYKIPTHADFLIAYSTVPGHLRILLPTNQLSLTLFVGVVQVSTPGAIQPTDLGSCKRCATCFPSAEEKTTFSL